MGTLARVAFVVAASWAWASPAAAQTTVGTVAELQAAVAAATGAASPVDIRIRAGTYDLPSALELSVAEGVTATLRSYGDGQVILTRAGGQVLRTGFATRRGHYVIKGLTFSGSGTGIEHEGEGIRIEGSTFVANDLGFYTDSLRADVTIVNSTFWNNGVPCGGFCGAIWLDAHQSAAIVNSTIVGTLNGPGIYGLDGFNGSGAQVLANSILLANSPDCSVAGGSGPTVVSSIDSDGTCASSQTTTHSVADFDLGGYGDHGGLVPTWPAHSFLPSNPVIRAGDPTACPPLDARGAIRHSPCDIGAYESTPHGFTLDSATGAGEVTLQTAPGMAAFNNFHAVAPHTLPQTGLPPGVTLPFGVFDWQAIVPPYGSLPIAITYPTVVSSPVRYWTFDARVGQWIDLCALQPCTLSADQRTVSFTLYDQGEGDLDAAEGRIRNPGGLVDGGLPPNVSLTKALLSSSTVDNGAAVTYRLTASNLGAGPTTGATTVTDSLDPALTFLAATSDPRCTAAGHVVTCVAAGPLVAGGTETFDLSVQVGSNAAPAGGSIQVDNSATVSTAGDSNPSDDVSNTVVLTVNGGVPDLIVAKRTTSTFEQGGTGTYELRATNNGTAPTAGVYTVTDVMPAGLTATGASGVGWNCSTSTAATVICTSSAGLSPGQDAPPIAIGVSVSATAPASITNTATIAGGGETETTNNTSSVTSPVAPRTPDLTIAKTTTSLFVQGGTAAYDLVVRNVGDGATTGAYTIADQLPTGLSVSGTAPGAGWTCDASTATLVSCTRTAALAPGQTAPAVTINVAIAADAPASITNTATVAGGRETNPVNNVASVTSVVAPAVPDLAITKSTTSVFQPGGTASYVLAVRNAGTGPTTGLYTIRDAMPAGLTVAATAPGPGWDCSASTATALACSSVSVVPAGQAAPTVTLTVTIAPTAPASITNTATIEGGGDVNTANNASSVTSGFGMPDLTLTKSATSSRLAAGDPVAYTFTVRNQGTGPTSAAYTVTDFLPWQLELAGTPAGAGWTCTDEGGGSRNVVCTNATVIPPGGAAPVLTMPVSLRPNFSPAITNTARVAGGGETVVTNNTSSITTPVARPDLAIELLDPALGVGRTGVFHVVIRNVGSAAAPPGTEIRIDLNGASTPGAALPFSSVVLMPATGWTCVRSFSIVSCRSSVAIPADNLSRVAVAISVTVSTSLPPGFPVLVAATVSSPWDINFVNDRSTVLTHLAGPDLRIESLIVNLLQRGGTATVIVNVRNIGGGSTPPSGPGATYTLSLQAPPGLVFTTASGSGWACYIRNSHAECSRSIPLASYESAPPVTITAHVATNAPASITLRPWVLSGGFDSNPLNNRTSSTHAVAP